MSGDLEVGLKLYVRQVAQEVADQTSSKLIASIEQAIERVLERRQEDDLLQPLSKILNKSAPAARMHLVRHPELAKLGVKVGTRLHFRPSDVNAYLAAKAGGSR